MKSQAKLFFFTFLIFLGIRSNEVLAKRAAAPATPSPSFTSPFYLKVDPKITAKEVARESASSKDLPKPTQTYVVENFADSSLKAWWGFGDLSFDVVDNAVGQFEPTVDGRSLRLQGKTKHWGIGGCGRFIGLNAAQFNAMKFMVKGNAKSGHSGTLIVELYVAQDNKWMSDDTQRREYALKYECKFSHSLQINWQGWRLVTIPFKEFLADSPRIKKHFWDAAKQDATGTMVQIQFVVLAPQEKGEVDFQIGSIAFAKDPNLSPVLNTIDY